MNDTSPEIAAMVHDHLIVKSGDERFFMGSVYKIHRSTIVLP